jgi:phospholipid/cholesterol/gamma-HCH transport system substrate-binding protein
MATATPPRPPASSPPPPPRDPSPPGSRPVRGPSRGLTRPLAVGALALVVLIVVYLLFAGGGGATYKILFAEGNQLVKGDQVQVGGVPVGSIKNITLTSDYKALVTVHVDSSLTPLHDGTTASVRVPSLTSIANRYIALSPGPNNEPALKAGATLPTTATHGVVDLDQLFNTFNPKTRKGLQEFLQGSAEQYEGTNPDFSLTIKYFGPSLSAGSHLFSELDHEQAALTSFLVEGAKAVTTIAAHSESLTDLIGNTDTTFQAVGSQQASLARGLHELPLALAQGNRTFAELPPTLSALTQLVNVSKPNQKELPLFLSRLTSLVHTATPVVGNFSQAFSKPGPNNDFTDAIRALPALTQALSTASPNGVTAEKESVPITAPFGPYSPDLQGFVRDFGAAAGYYDANGHYARAAPVFADFALGANNTLTPVTPQQGLAGLKTGQLRRCPGSATQPAADGSSPFIDNALLGCDPSETP